MKFSQAVRLILAGFLLIPATCQTIVGLALDTPELATLTSLATRAGLVGFLSAENANLTVFAPTNDAFAALPTELFDNLATSNYLPALTRILSHHVLTSVVFSSDINDGAVVDSLLATQVPLGTAPLTFSLDNGDVFVSGRGFNNSQVVIPNITADNGVVHVVDQVFVPEIICCVSLLQAAADADPDSTLVALLRQTGLDQVVDTETMTVFAPVQEVFDGLSEGALDDYNVTEVLLNHVVLGPPISASMLAEGMTVTTALGLEYETAAVNGTVFIGGIPIVVEDVVASNGIGQYIEGVLLPPPPDIVDLAVGSENLTTLVSLVQEAGLVEALQASDANVTVFAPTNQAFDALPSALVTKLFTESYLPALGAILAHHLVDGVVFSTDITDGLVVNSRLAPLTPLGTSPLTFSVDDNGDVFVSGRGFNDSQVILPNLEATNGIVHVVDQVFVPEVVCCATVFSNLAALDPNGTLVALLEQTGLSGALDDPDQELTLFAPAQEVFDALPDGALDGDLGGFNARDILLNHVVYGPPITVAMMASEMSITTVLNVTYQTSVNAEGIPLIGNVPVEVGDFVASNGLVHLISDVLIPPTPTAPPTHVPTVMPSPSPTLDPASTPGPTTEEPTEESPVAQDAAWNLWVTPCTVVAMMAACVLAN